MPISRLLNNSANAANAALHQFTNNLPTKNQTTMLCRSKNTKAFDLKNCSAVAAAANTTTTTGIIGDNKNFVMNMNQKQQQSTFCQRENNNVSGSLDNKFKNRMQNSDLNLFTTNQNKTMKNLKREYKTIAEDQKQTIGKDNCVNQSTASAVRNNVGLCVSLDSINPNFISMEYAVRGPLLIRAGEIEKELEKGVKKPFDQVIRANIGDCHATGQKPITFLRQVMTLTVAPELFSSPNYPEDAKQRAKLILEGCQGHSVGSYTDSAGLEVVRRQVADYIKNRDGIDSDWQNIILTAGATPGIKSLISMLRCDVNGKPPGVMIPIPQYPLYSATIAEYGMEQIGYYLDEANKWALDINELKRSLNEARKTCCVRALCIINPGNPTGQVLTRDNIEKIIKFAHEEKLFLFADEVYQDNIYDEESKFHSFKKVLTEMGPPYSDLELASFMSTSKGYLGECGIRGGYCEIINLCPKVKAMLLKSISASLCPTTAGQVAVSCLVNPPKKGEPSYELYIKEKMGVLNALKERAELVYKTFNSFEGFTCNPVQGAMYAFPKILIPKKAVQAAKQDGKTPDAFYAFQLLEATGICIVPGSGFGQRPGTYHFRTTILPQTDKLKIMLDKFQTFHAKFMENYK